MTRKEETTYSCYKPVRKTKKRIAEEAKRFSFLYPSESKEMFFIYGAEWADKTMLEKVCEFFKPRLTAFIGREDAEELIAEFRKAMKGGTE